MVFLIRKKRGKQTAFLTLKPSKRIA